MDEDVRVWQQPLSRNDLLGSEERTPVPRVQARTLDQQAGAEVAAAILHHGCHTD